MDVLNGPGPGINSFALVSYLAGPLADFLNELRRDFAPDSQAKAHLTLLPPRPLPVVPEPESIAQAWKHARQRLQEFNPVRVELGDVQVFPLNRVIYLSIGAGAGELRDMHDRLATGPLAFDEPFPYLPHVTIVQELLPADVPAAADFARWRWNEFSHRREFTMERLTFVQNTSQNFWTDLAELDLANELAL